MGRSRVLLLLLVLLVRRGPMLLLRRQALLLLLVLPLLCMRLGWVLVPGLRLVPPRPTAPLRRPILRLLLMRWFLLMRWLLLLRGRLHGGRLP